LGADSFAKALTAHPNPSRKREGSNRGRAIQLSEFRYNRCAVCGARYIGFADAIYPADTIYKYDMFRFAKRDLIGEFSPSAKIFLNIPQSGIYRAAGISYPKDISRLRSKHITRRPQTAQPPRFLFT
jgi:hypothetical protein